MQNKYQEYQKYVKEKIDALNVIFANAAIGDFSHNVEVPEEDDMFLQLYVGVQTMLEVIRTQLREMHTLNHSLERRVNERTLTLIEAEKRYRAVLESAPDALVIVDQTGTITIVNSQTEQMFGYRREELIGQTIEMLLPEQLRKKHAGYRL